MEVYHVGSLQYKHHLVKTMVCVCGNMLLGAVHSLQCHHCQWLVIVTSFVSLLTTCHHNGLVLAPMTLPLSSSLSLSHSLSLLLSLSPSLPPSPSLFQQRGWFIQMSYTVRWQYYHSLQQHVIIIFCIYFIFVSNFCSPYISCAHKTLQYITK